MDQNISNHDRYYLNAILQIYRTIMGSIHGLGTSIWNNVYTCFPNCHWYNGKYSFGNSYHNILVYVIGFCWLHRFCQGTILHNLDFGWWSCGGRWLPTSRVCPNYLIKFLLLMWLLKTCLMGTFGQSPRWPLCAIGCVVVNICVFPLLFESFYLEDFRYLLEFSVVKFRPWTKLC